MLKLMNLSTPIRLLERFNIIVAYQFLHIYNLFRAFKLQSTGEKVRQAKKNHGL